jgi:transposase
VAADFKKAAAYAAHIVLIDESGALLSPLLRRSLAPAGHTPVIASSGGTRQKVSLTAAISLSPLQRKLNLYFQTWPQLYVDPELSAWFLRGLLHHLKGPVIVLWDRGPVHHGEAIRQLQEQYPRLMLEELPPYAPDCNPVEWLWKHLKWDELANYCPTSVAELDQRLQDLLQQAHADPDRLASCFAASELDLDVLDNPAVTT